MNIKKTALICALILSFGTMCFVACDKNEISENNAVSHVGNLKSYSPIQDGIYKGVQKRENSTSVYFTFYVKEGIITEYTAVDEKGEMAIPEDADIRGPFAEPIDAYGQFIDMCKIDEYPCVAIIPTTVPDLNNGGLPHYHYFVIGCDYSENGDCWYNE